MIVSQFLLFLFYWSFFTSVIIPRPLEIYQSFIATLSNGTLFELWTSFSTNVEAIIISTVLSLFIAYYSVFILGKPFAYVVAKCRFSGLTGYTFLFTLVFGGGHSLKLALLVFGMTTFFVTSMVAVIAEVIRKGEELDYARTLRLSEWKVFYEVIILGTKEYAIEIMAQNTAMGWMMLTAVEGMIRSEGGIGAALLDQNRHFHLADVFAIQLLILLTGAFKDGFIGYMKFIICPYAQGRK